MPSVVAEPRVRDGEKDKEKHAVAKDPKRERSVYEPPPAPPEPAYPLNELVIHRETRRTEG